MGLLYADSRGKSCVGGAPMSAPCRSEHSTKFDTGDKSTLTSGDGEPLVRRESTVDKGDGFNVKQRLCTDFRRQSRHLTSSLCTFTYNFRPARQCAELIIATLPRACTDASKRAPPVGARRVGGGWGCYTRTAEASPASGVRLCPPPAVRSIRQNSTRVTKAL